MPTFTNLTAVQPIARNFSALASPATTTIDPRRFGSVLQPSPFTVLFPGFRFPPGPVTPPPAATPQPASATASATDLQVLMSQVPVADDGDVIRSEHFNLMRAALFEIAGRLGVGPLQTEMVSSIVPAFFKQATSLEWTAEYGIAKASAVGDTKGWMELDLPDGARLQEMKVFAKRAGAGAFNVVLKRQKITDPTDTVDLITVPITASTDAKLGETGAVKVAVSDPSALEEYRKIDNRTYNYLLVAEVTLAATETAQVNAVQIVCRNVAA